MKKNLDKNLISLKIRELREEKKLSQSEFSNEIGVSQQTISQIEKGIILPSLDVLSKITSNFCISYDSLLSESFANPNANLNANLNTEKEVQSNNVGPPVGIPLIPIEAMAGFGTGEFIVNDSDVQERFVVPTFKGADYLISVKGSSMYPKYNSGDIVACKKLNINDIFFQWNKVYVLDTEQGALIKRVRKAKDEKHILCVSDNENYDPFELHKSKINAIAIVMGVIRLE